MIAVFRQFKRAWMLCQRRAKSAGDGTHGCRAVQLNSCSCFQWLPFPLPGHAFLHLFVKIRFLFEICVFVLTKWYNAQEICFTRKKWEKTIWVFSKSHETRLTIAFFSVARGWLSSKQLSQQFWIRSLPFSKTCWTTLPIISRYNPVHT